MKEDCCDDCKKYKEALEYVYDMFLRETRYADKADEFANYAMGLETKFHEMLAEKQIELF